MRKLQWFAFFILSLYVIYRIVTLDPSKVHLVGSKSTDITFKTVPLSQNNTEKSILRVTSGVTLHFDDNRSETYPLFYQMLAKTGQKIGDGVFGMITDAKGKPMLDVNGKPRLSVQPDGTSLLKVGRDFRLLTHMEEAPGMVYDTTLKLTEQKRLRAVKTKPVDMRPVNGTIIDCAASKTDYGTHLGGEEDYSMNSRYADVLSPFYTNCRLDGTFKDTKGRFSYFCAYVENMAGWLGDNSIDKMKGYNGKVFTPYNYGHIIEIAPKSLGRGEVVKHFVLGRYTPELAVMMPDHRTLYMSDDGNFKGFYKFVLDKPVTTFTPEWKGTLYAAKLSQRSAQNGGSFSVHWRELGHAKDSEIAAMVKQKMRLSDMFDIAKPDASYRCPEDYRKINEDDATECLRLKPGMHRAAAFLETRKYAAYLGATMEFRKGEGITFDPVSRTLFLSLSSIDKSMTDDYEGMEVNNDMRLEQNFCGGVYAFALDGNFSAVSMQALLTGTPLDDESSYAAHYRCDPENIANPDNILYLGSGILIIGEDGPNHVNNMLWAYHLKSKKLMRIASLPIGAEVTGLDKAVIAGEGVLVFNVQHPFADMPKNMDEETPDEALIDNATAEQKWAQVGYIGGLPAGLLKN